MSDHVFLAVELFVEVDQIVDVIGAASVGRS
jgi:hypothetical protein